MVTRACPCVLPRTKTDFVISQSLGPGLERSTVADNTAPSFMPPFSSHAVLPLSSLYLRQSLCRFSFHYYRSVSWRPPIHTDMLDPLGMYAFALRTLLSFSYPF